MCTYTESDTESDREMWCGLCDIDDDGEEEDRYNDVDDDDDYDEDDDDDDDDDDDGTTYALCLGPHQVILAKAHFPQSGRIFITVTFSNLRSVGPFCTFFYLTQH